VFGLHFQTGKRSERELLITGEKETQVAAKEEKENISNSLIDSFLTTMSFVV
jgi:hypothetical protein